MTDKPPGGFMYALRSAIPKREVLAEHPLLKPIAHRVLARELWHLQHASVARGAAIGMFWAFSVPFAQVLFAAAHCVWWRANIPVAAAVTFITNPFTIGFWLWLAYQVGHLLTNAPPPTMMPMPTSAAEVAQWVRALGWPALIGMAFFAMQGAILAYFAVYFGWRARVALKRRGWWRGRGGGSHSPADRSARK